MRNTAGLGVSPAYSKAAFPKTEVLGKLYFFVFFANFHQKMKRPAFLRRIDTEASMYVMAYAPYGAGGIIIRVEADIRR
jgi:hypothetical protein